MVVARLRGAECLAAFTVLPPQQTAARIGIGLACAIRIPDGPEPPLAVVGAGSPADAHTVSAKACLFLERQAVCRIRRGLRECILLPAVERRAGSRYQASVRKRICRLRKHTRIIHNGYRQSPEVFRDTAVLRIRYRGNGADSIAEAGCPYLSADRNAV